MAGTGPIFRKRPKKAVGPRLRILLIALLVAFALLAINSGYLASVTFSEWWTGETFQGYAYQVMFLFHLAVGLLIIVPLLVFMGIHAARAWTRPNRRAVYAGLGLMGIVLALLVSGLLLVRFDFFQINDPRVRNIAYWAHVVTPLLAVWAFVLHRLAGPKIRWGMGLKVAGVGALFVAAIVVLETQDPRQWNRPGVEGEVDFSPALTRSATGRHIPAETLMMDGYCQQCHADVHAQWSQSVHKWASFNNPVYLFAVRNTRQHSMEIDGTMDAARFCAGCHDLVPLLSGAFDDPNYDDVNDPTSQAGITCTGCHAITHVNSPKGNGDFTIEEPIHYPFALSDNGFLQWVNNQLIKANPGFHERTFLKPFHETPEFCGPCHKVHLPEQLNQYKWLRGQNHYDSFLLSGVSGHGVTSFYYPPEAEPNCNGCHMPLIESDEFGADRNDDSGRLTVHDHLFPSANTAIPHLVGLEPSTIEAHREFLDGSVRVDLVALREDGEVDGELIGPIRPAVPALEPGRAYLLQAVLRTMTLGHLFTQGTVDSNEVWVEVEVLHEGRRVGHSGGLDPERHAVDPWSHFVNVYMLDRDGNRIDRRNAEDIFTPLYNHQIPPGAADVVHYRLEVPESLTGELDVRIRLNYRKFDATLMAYVLGEDFIANDLPISIIDEDRVVFPIASTEGSTEDEGRVVDARDIPEWQRWNDYGIALLRKPERRQLRQAEEVFQRVEALGSSHGPINLARVYLAEGRLDEAGEALSRAAAHETPPPPWSLAWFSGRLLFERGQFAEAIDQFTALAETRFNDARQRGFDFSRDYRLLNQLGLTWLEVAGQQADDADRRLALTEAARWFEAALVQDPENAEAHYNQARAQRGLGDEATAERHAALYETYRVDDNARDVAVAAARRANPAADHLADPVVVLELQREGREAYSLSAPEVEGRNGANTERSLVHDG
jgi:tetratricopeptide (TPR) repeat protein